MLVRLDLLGLVSDNTHELANERIYPPRVHGNAPVLTARAGEEVVGGP